MGRHAKTQQMLAVAIEVLQENNPMTVRQVYYQLVSRQVIENNRGQYQAVSNLLVEARKSGEVPWGWIEDRLRRPRTVAMWDDLKGFAQVAQQYRRDVWANQAEYVEVWLEKDALSGIFEEELEPYGITLNVGRGYDGWDSIRNAALRILSADSRHESSHILYFGDFDPSGEDMARSLEERLEFFGAMPLLTKCALTAEDVERYNLPPDPAKKTDSRAAAFIEKHGDVSVELDALPVEVLRTRIREEVEGIMDLDALEEIRQVEKTERGKVVRALDRIAKKGQEP